MRLKRTYSLAVITISILAASTAAAFAATTTSAAITVTANVLSFCTIAPSALPFGVYSSAAVSGSALLTVVCTASTSYTVGLDAGTTTGGSVATRLMTNGTSTLQYKLYTDASHTSNFNLSGAGTVTGTGNGLSQTITVYGQIVAGQNVSPGNYTDTVTATLTY